MYMSFSNPASNAPQAANEDLDAFTAQLTTTLHNANASELEARRAEVILHLTDALKKNDQLTLLDAIAFHSLDKSVKSTLMEAYPKAPLMKMDHHARAFVSMNPEVQQALQEAYPNAPWSKAEPIHKTGKQIGSQTSSISVRGG